MRETAVMGMESSIARDERKFKLQMYIEQGKIITLKSASQAMGLTEATIVGYLKEMDLQLWDTKKGNFVGAKDGKRVGQDIHLIQ